LISGYLGLREFSSSSTQNTPHDTSLGVEGTDPEIQHHVNTLQFTPQVQEWYNATALTNKLIAVFNLAQLSDNLKKRFERIVESRLVDARSPEEIKDRLTRGEKIGGLGISDSAAIQVVAAIEKEHDRIHQLHLKVKTEAGEVINEPKPILPKPHLPHVHPVQPKPEITKSATPLVTDISPKPEPKASVQSLRPTPLKPQPAFVVPPPKPSIPVAAPAPQPIEELPPARPHVDVPHFMPRVFRQQSDQGRPTVSDIRQANKLVGPVEELKAMSIQDFRMLGESTEERTTRLKEKIRLLEKESFQKRSEGIKALRQSPLMQEYLSVGGDSMEQNLTIGQVVGQRKSLGKSTMTAEEFDIISEFNSQLRF
jgi:hypothetical protein